MSLLPEDLDTNKWLLNCDNGTIDLKSGDLLDHDREHYITKLAPVVYKKNAGYSRWNEFMHKIMGGEKDLIDHLQRVVGYSLTGETGEKCLFLLLGPTDSGKTTFIEIIRHLLGDYAKGTDFQTFLYSKYGGSKAIRNDIARLEGARFVSASEAAKDQMFDEPLLKQITGRDTVAARFLYKEFTEYKPEFKVFLASNEKPSISGLDDAIWNRINVIPFNVSIPKEDQDKLLEEKLKKELSGILAWAVDGCRKWHEEKSLKPSKSVVEALKVIRADSDAILKFIDDCCYRLSGVYTTFSELYDEWKNWCGKNNVISGSEKSFAELLKVKGYDSSRIWIGDEQHRIRRGLMLKYKMQEELEKRGSESIETMVQE